MPLNIISNNKVLCLPPVFNTAPSNRLNTGGWAWSYQTPAIQEQTCQQGDDPGNNKYSYNEQDLTPAADFFHVHRLGTYKIDKIGGLITDHG